MQTLEAPQHVGNAASSDLVTPDLTFSKENETRATSNDAYETDNEDITRNNCRWNEGDVKCHNDTIPYQGNKRSEVIFSLNLHEGHKAFEPPSNDAVDVHTIQQAISTALNNALKHRCSEEHTPVVSVPNFDKRQSMGIVAASSSHLVSTDGDSIWRELWSHC